MSMPESTRTTRITPFRQPAADFNALKASPRVLSLYGLPFRPNVQLTQKWDRRESCRFARNPANDLLSLTTWVSSLEQATGCRFSKVADLA
jgi:hypothetical protein